MKISRRELLAGSAALALYPSESRASSPHGSAGGAIPTGWNTLPLGAGGLFTGFDIATDGSLVTRSDVGGVYRFTGTITQLSDPSKTWVTLQSNDSLKNSIGTGVYTPAAGVPSCYNIAVAPSLSSRMFAIFPCNGGTSEQWALFYSNDSGGTWKQTGYPSGTAITFHMPDQGSAGAWRNSAYNIAVDPINPDIVYCGTRNSDAGSSGATAGAYVALDGFTFNPVTTNGVTVIGSPQYEPGSSGILFDPNYGTITVAGQLRTKRIMLPVSGQGIFESLDGGQNFTATDLTPFGRTDLTVIDMKMDFNGTCYALISFGTSAPNGAAVAFWRYSGPGGVWESFTAQSNFPSFLKTSASPYGGAIPLIVDPRSGHAGSFQISANGISTGFTSVNANLGTTFNPGSIASLTWTGSPNPISSHLTAPSFDCPWLNHVAGTIGYVYGTACRIDPVSGYCVWTGNQGALWLFTLSDLVTPTVPNFGSASNLYSVGTSRGTEATVAQDIQCAPGASFPCIAAQDVGIFASSLSRGFYPTDFFPSPAREDCEALEYAASDPSFYVGKVNGEVTVLNSSGAPIIGGFNSGYSDNYGAAGSWTKYTIQPDPMFCSSIRGSISAGVLTVNSFNAGNGFGNFITTAGNNFVYIKNTTYGNVTGQLTGSAGGTGTYQLSGSATVAGPVTFVIQPIFAGGQIVAVDADHHVAVAASAVGSAVNQFIPIYTTNARANPCAWNFTNLPLGQWMRRIGGYAYGATSRPFAVGYGSDLGTVWAIGGPGGISGTVNLYRSTDSGATYSQITSFSYSSNAIGIYLLSVPGYPGELWLAGNFSSGVTSCIYHITGANTGSPTVTLVASPTANKTSLVLTMGAPQSPGGYPTFYGLFWHGWGSAYFIYEGQWNGTVMNWSLFGSTGTLLDLPAVQNTPGNSITSIRGDWNTYQKIYAATGNKGFAYYNP
jgi:hypothetical protein